jgi:hypothetical protein
MTNLCTEHLSRAVYFAFVYSQWLVYDEIVNNFVGKFRLSVHRCHCHVENCHVGCFVVSECA